tara:strand:- start:6 stop:149 length:144 start_codon:yes stop_codon:yes gene_type:complete
MPTLKAIHICNFAPADTQAKKLQKSMSLPTLKHGRKIKPAGNNVYKK